MAGDLTCVLVVLGLRAVPVDLPTAVGLAGAGSVLAWSGAARPRFTLSWLEDVPHVVAAAVVGVTAAAAVSHATGTVSTGASWELWAVLLVAVLIGRAAVVTATHRLRRRGHLTRRVLVVGDEVVRARLARAANEHPEYGAQVVGTIDALGESARDPDHDPDGLRTAMGSSQVTDVIVASSTASAPDLLAVRRACRALGCRLYVAALPGERNPLGQRRSDAIWAIPLRRVAHDPSGVVGWRAKRVFDIVVSLLGLVAVAPVLAVVAVAVRIEGGPGVIFRQTRIGRDDEPFTMYKFRSFRPTDEEEQLTRWSVSDDPRLGPVGKLIRRYSLDELPQLVNVLRGDMSLVGPRPERPHYVERFSRANRHYPERHRVPPGLTGLAAVHELRGDSSIDDRATFDNQYIDHWSLWLDMSILLRTIAVVVRGTGS